VTESRQKPINTKKLNTWLQQDPQEFCNEEMMRNYNRNQILIDLQKIPEALSEDIVGMYETTEARDKSRLFNYFMKNKMKQLMEHLQEF
jgi:hypothetical protein